MNGNRKGFTLIELLVVIAIIAILAAILFPIFTRAKARAQMTGCTNNMKQWAAGLTRYLDDNDGRFPFTGANGWYQHNPAVDGGDGCLPNTLKKYVSNCDKIRWCPRHMDIIRKSETTQSELMRMQWSYWYFCGHCGYQSPPGNKWVLAYRNSQLCGYDSNGASRAFTIGEVTAPSKKPAVTEISAIHDPEGDGGGGVFYPLNIAYVDGHVKTWVVNFNSRVFTSYVGRDGVMPTELLGPHGGH